MFKTFKEELFYKWYIWGILLRDKYSADRIVCQTNDIFEVFSREEPNKHIQVRSVANANACV